MFGGSAGLGESLYDQGHDICDPVTALDLVAKF